MSNLRYWLTVALICVAAGSAVFLGVIVLYLLALYVHAYFSLTDKFAVARFIRDKLTGYSSISLDL